jgi:hypothetical protein
MIVSAVVTLLAVQLHWAPKPIKPEEFGTRLRFRPVVYELDGHQKTPEDAEFIWAPLYEHYKARQGLHFHYTFGKDRIEVFECAIGKTEKKDLAFELFAQGYFKFEMQVGDTATAVRKNGVSLVLISRKGSQADTVQLRDHFVPYKPGS